MSKTDSKIRMYHFLYHLEDDGIFPNSSLPAVLYRHAIELPRLFRAAAVRCIFDGNGWRNAWDGGVFSYHHYHSITHEVLGFYKGSTTLLLGGDNGRQVRVTEGDVLIIPAGIAHRNLGHEKSICCIGAYPGSAEYDIRMGYPGERPYADRNIAAVPLPATDPVFGSDRGIISFWNAKK